MPKKIHGPGSRLGPHWETGGQLCCQGVGGRQREAGPVEGPGPAWVRLCSLGCFSCHCGDGFINICCSFLPRPTASLLPGKQDRLPISQKANRRTWGLRPTVTRGVWEEARTTVKISKAFPIATSTCKQNRGPRRCPWCSATVLRALFLLDTPVVGAGGGKRAEGRWRREKREGRATGLPVHIRKAETGTAHSARASDSSLWEAL